MVLKVVLSIEFIVTILMISWKICETRLRILGGRDALRGEFPFTVRLEELTVETISGKQRFEYIRFCTGAAVTPFWILTAAHCNDDNLPIVYKHLDTPKFARYDSYFPNELGHLSRLTEFLAYPGYSNTFFGAELTNKHDIALFRTEKVIVSQYVRISPIDYVSFVGGEVVLLGYGGTNATPTEKPLQVLQGALTKCDEALGLITNFNRRFHLTGFMCVATKCGLVATICGGDSGGPVVHASGVVGVNSMSEGNCDEFTHKLYPGHPAAIVSMVSPVIDWISKTINNKSDESV